jgi:hypothetical protein
MGRPFSSGIAPNRFLPVWQRHSPQFANCVRYGSILPARERRISQFHKEM